MSQSLLLLLEVRKVPGLPSWYVKLGPCMKMLECQAEELGFIS